MRPAPNPPHRRTLVAVAASFLLALTANAWAAPPPGLSDEEWHAIEAELAAEIDAEIDAKAGPANPRGSAPIEWVELSVKAAELGDQNNPGTQVRHGYSVDVAGDWMIVGTPYRQRSDGAQAGAAFIYRRVGGASWQQHQRILFGPALGHAHCGVSVAIWGEHAVAGCPGYTSDGLSERGRTVMLRRGTNGQYNVSEIFLGDVADARCGYKVAIHGGGVDAWAASTCFGRAPAPGDATGLPGKVEVYRWDLPGETGWALETVLGNGPIAGIRLGHGLALHRYDNGLVRVLVGVPGNRPTVDSPNAGRATMYRRNAADNWTQEITLTRPDGHRANAEFGHNVALHDRNLVVGAPGDGIASLNHGLAYPYTSIQGPGWTPGPAIVPPGVVQFQPDGRFGHAVALQFGELWVSQPQLQIVDAMRGRVVRYVRTSTPAETPAYAWQQTIVPGDEWTTDGNNGFGTDLAIDMDSGAAVVGSPWARRAEGLDVVWRGRAFIYGIHSDTIFSNGFE